MIGVEWDNGERTIIRLDVPNHWEWSELSTVQEQFTVMAQSVPYIVHTIIDISKTRHLPNNALSNLKRYTSRKPVNMGLIVVVGANRIVRAILQMFQKIDPREGRHFVFAETIAEARALITEHGHQPSGTPS